jgi:hypothetical protein
MGLRVDIMLTSSVNVVQSSLPDTEQGDISGLSRSVSNLGSSLGTALATASLLVIALIASFSRSSCPAARRDLTASTDRWDSPSPTLNDRGTPNLGRSNPSPPATPLLPLARLSEAEGGSDIGGGGGVVLRCGTADPVRHWSDRATYTAPRTGRGSTPDYDM